MGADEGRLERSRPLPEAAAAAAGPPVTQAVRPRGALDAEGGESQGVLAVVAILVPWG